MRQTQRLGYVPKTAIEKSLWLFVANLVYHRKQIGKNSFSDKAKDRISFEIAREANLILVARETRATPQKPWRFLQIAAEKTAKNSESLIAVRRGGFEPPTVCLRGNCSTN